MNISPHLKHISTNEDRMAQSAMTSTISSESKSAVVNVWPQNSTERYGLGKPLNPLNPLLHYPFEMRSCIDWIKQKYSSAFNFLIHFIEYLHISAFSVIVTVKLFETLISQNFSTVTNSMCFENSNVRSSLLFSLKTFGQVQKCV